MPTNVTPENLKFNDLEAIVEWARIEEPSLRTLMQRLDQCRTATTRQEQTVTRTSAIVPPVTSSSTVLSNLRTMLTTLHRLASFDYMTGVRLSNDDAVLCVRALLRQQQVVTTSDASEGRASARPSRLSLALGCLLLGHYMQFIHGQGEERNVAVMEVLHWMRGHLRHVLASDMSIVDG